MRNEDAGDDGGDSSLVGTRDMACGVANRGEEVSIREDVRRGVPDQVPAVGERGGARFVLDEEAGCWNFPLILALFYFGFSREHSLQRNAHMVFRFYGDVLGLAMDP